MNRRKNAMRAALIGLAAALALSACSSGSPDSKSNGVAQPTGQGSSASTQQPSSNEASAPAPSGGSTSGALGGADEAMEKLYEAAVAGGESKVVVYGGLVQQLQPTFDAFHKRYPKISIETQVTYGATLSAKVSQEFTSGQRVADVVETGLAPSATFYKAGQLMTYIPDNAKVADQWVGPEKTFAWVALQPFGLFYNSKKLTKETAPSSWASLTDAAWKGRLDVPDPTNPGGTAEAVAMMLQANAISLDYVKKLKANDVKVDSDWPPAMTTVVTGQREVALWLPYGNYQTQKQKGADVGFQFPMSDANYLSPFGMLALKDPPHPNATKLLITYFFTPEGQKTLGDEGYYGTAEGDFGTPPGLPGLSQVANPVPLPPIADSAKIQNDWITKMKTIF